MTKKVIWLAIGIMASLAIPFAIHLFCGGFVNTNKLQGAEQMVIALVALQISLRDIICTNKHLG